MFSILASNSSIIVFAVRTCAEVNCSAVDDPVLLVTELKLGVGILHLALHPAIIQLLVAVLWGVRASAMAEA